MKKNNDLILFSHIDQKYNNTEIIRSDKIFTIVYDGNFFTLKLFNKINPNSKINYKKFIFNSEKRAKTLAKKLNKKYFTNKFSVVELKIL